MPPVIKVSNLSKQYRLGQVGTGTISHDVNRWWHKIRGKEDPYLKIGESNDRTVKGESDYVWALKDINFAVQQGEVLGIIGRNGAGKSTMLNLITGLCQPTSGAVMVNGKVAALLELGSGFHPDLTGAENVLLNAALLGTLAFVTFARMHGHLDGQMIAFFTMVVAACEVVIGLAIIMTIFRARKSASVDDANLLKG